MKTISCACLVAAALVLGHLPLTAAAGAKFRYLASVYFDDKGAGINLPEGIACDANGQVVVGDTGNDRLLRFAYQDNKVSGGSVIKIPQLAAPSRIQLDSKGEIYALDAKQRRIVRLSPAGEFKDALAFDGVPPPATVVPKGFAIDSADNIYVLDVFSARVLVLNAQGKFQRALALPQAAGFVSDLAVDTTGNVLLLDSISRRIFSAAKDATAFAPLGGDLTEFLNTMPTYITASKGVIFVVEGSGSSIVGFGLDGSFLGRQLTMGWDEGSLNHPSQICINDKDEVFIADRDNSRIQVFRLTR
jgi:DNA-binding beta-propeller fold protein YncE